MVGIDNTALEGSVHPSLIISFVVGAIVLVTTIAITVASTKEYSPEKTAAFDDNEETEIKEAEESGKSKFKL